MVDGWRGDDWFHNGAFRTGSLDLLVAHEHRQGRRGAGIAVGTGDDYTALPRSGLDGRLRAEASASSIIPFVQKLFQNPAYTDFWSRQAVDKWMAARPLTVPTMIEVGAVGPGRQLWRAGGLQGAQGQI